MKSISFLYIFCVLAVSHSHTTRVFHPCLSSSLLTISCRLTVFWNFFVQKSCLLLGVYAYLQPGCRCQKQPWTKITALYLGKTISGQPGSLLTWIRNLYPILWSMERTITSGFVSLPLILDMFQLRFSLLNLSIKGSLGYVPQFISLYRQEVNIDFQLLSVNEENSEEVDIMLVAAKKAMIIR